MSHDELNRIDEQFLVSIRGIKIKMRGLVLLILALGIAAAMGAIVIVKMTIPEGSAVHLQGGPGDGWSSVTSVDMTHLPRHPRWNPRSPRAEPGCRPLMAAPRKSPAALPTVASPC